MEYKEIATRLLALPDQERAVLADAYTRAFRSRDDANKQIENLNEALLRKTETTR